MYMWFYLLMHPKQTVYKNDRLMNFSHNIAVYQSVVTLLATFDVGEWEFLCSDIILIEVPP